jgi:hypothetical protein
MGLTMHQKKALTREIAVRYRSSARTEKKQILDEFTRTTGYHRKYAITLLAHEGKLRPLATTGKPVQALIRHKSRPKRYITRESTTKPSGRPS